jgi:hypothetical protein
MLKAITGRKSFHKEPETALWEMTPGRLQAGVVTILTFFRMHIVMLIMMPCSALIRREIYKKIFPAQDAAEAGDLVKVRTLLGKNPNLVLSKHKNEFTPLHVAARYGHKEVADLPDVPRSVPDSEFFLLNLLKAFHSEFGSRSRTSLSDFENAIEQFQLGSQSTFKSAENRMSG